MTLTSGEDRSVTFTWADPAGPLALLPEMAGLAYLEAVRDGQVPRPPIAAVMQLELREVQPGRVEFLGQPTEAHFNPLGTDSAEVLVATATSALLILRPPAS